MRDVKNTSAANPVPRRSMHDKAVAKEALRKADAIIYGETPRKPVMDGPDLHQNWLRLIEGSQRKTKK